MRKYEKTRKKGKIYEEKTYYNANRRENTGKSGKRKIS